MTSVEEWTAAPLKHWASARPSNIDKLSAEGEQSIRLCNYVDVYKNERITEEMKLMPATASDVQIERFTLKRHDVIITKDSETPDDIGVPAHVSMDLPGVVCGYHLTLLRPKPHLLYGGFLFWALQTSTAHDYFATSALGITRFALNTTDIEQFPLVAPGLADQERIANFLDMQTARIDALIAEKERLLLTVNELFNARLGTAVVEGIDNKGRLVAAVSKGFEAVREDWALLPLKYLATSSGGMTPSTNNAAFWDGEIPWVSPKDMKRFVLDDSMDHVTEDALSATSLRLHPVDSVLVVVRGMILAHTFPVAMNAVPVTVNQDMKVLRTSGRVSAKYLAWMLRGLQPLILTLTDESAHGTKALRTDQWENQPVPVPSLQEQVELVAQFEKWEQKTTELSSHLGEHLARLREYRSSLISAAVTGQLDICSFKEAA